MLGILEITLIFGLGSIAGWIIEVFYRSIFEEKRLVNPGFLNGPYLPIYGFGTLALYLLSLPEMNIIYRLLLFALATTLLELITGLIFIYYYNLRLWDYTKDWLNYKGLICPLHSLYWTVLAAAFFKWLFPPLVRLAELFSQHTSYSFILGFFYGVFIVDMFNSFSMAFKLRRFIKAFNKRHLSKLKVNYDMFKKEVSLRLKQMKKEDFLKRYFLSPNIFQTDILTHLENFLTEARNKMKREMKKR